MAITEQQKDALTRLAEEALESIEEDFGPEARLGDAAVVFRVELPGSFQVRHRATGDTRDTVRLLNFGLNGVISEGRADGEEPEA